MCEVLKAEGWAPASGRGESEQTRTGDARYREKKARSGRDGGQVRWVWSRDETGMSGGDCPRERLDDAPHVSLTFLPKTPKRGLPSSSPSWFCPPYLCVPSKRGASGF